MSSDIVSLFTKVPVILALRKRLSEDDLLTEHSNLSVDNIMLLLKLSLVVFFPGEHLPTGFWHCSGDTCISGRVMEEVEERKHWRVSAHPSGSGNVMLMTFIQWYQRP